MTADKAALEELREQIKAHDLTKDAVLALAERLDRHVVARGGPSKDEDGNPVLPNGAWQMMLDAATMLHHLAPLLDVAGEEELVERIAQARAEQREACAQLADDYSRERAGSWKAEAADDIAAAIRARKEQADAE